MEEDDSDGGGGCGVHVVVAGRDKVGTKGGDERDAAGAVSW